MLAVLLSRGDLCIVSDCSHVVNTFKWLARHGFNPALLAKLDNADLWAAISAVLVACGGDVTVFKVKAHVSGSCPAQDPWFTKHKEAADKLAKAAARELWLTKYNALLGEVSQGLDLQSHLIASLVKRLNCLQIPFDEGKDSTGGHCTCQPVRRIRFKRSGCQGDCAICHAAGVATADKVLLESIRLSLPVQPSVWQPLRHRYPAYWAVFARDYSWGPGPASAVQDTNWSRHPNSRFLHNLLEFWSQSRWHFPNDPNVSDARITWQELVFDFIGEFGIVKGLFEPHTRLSLLTRRFRDQSVKLLAAAGLPVVGLTRIPHLRCFSGGNAAGICPRRNFKCPHVVWGFLVHHCSNNSKRLALAQNRPNAYYTPSWDFLPK